MKFNKDNKYLYWGVTAFLVLAAAICFYFLLSDGKIIRFGLKEIVHICTPIIDGLVIAYLFAPLVNLLERKIFLPLYKKYGVALNVKSFSRMRAFSIFFTFCLIAFVIYLFISIIIPQLYNSIINIYNLFPVYVNNLTIYINKLLENNPTIEQTVNTILINYSAEFQNWINTTVLPNINDLLKTLSMSLISFVKASFNLLVGFIVSIYVLSNKEKFTAQGKKTIYALFKKETANTLNDDIHFINLTFGGFIRGKLLDSVIIGILCFICVSIFRFPYPFLISVIIGITNIIPFFGPFIGAVPCALIILLINPLQCLYFIIFVLVLQTVDGNIIGPKILGSSTGVSSFWIIFSITVFGGLWGVFGMIVGVPLFAVLYTIFKRHIYKSLKTKGMPVNSSPYENLVKIDENNAMIYRNSEIKPVEIQETKP